ncbi:MULTISPECIES: hydroxymethylglutaryl-CoA lyase [unclassified Rummeliibacillus]|mgnify:CR=1 FL=1|uniref:hydroxymethylglutaryl-CoA lyase n=1 Tax=unclassified Rummeliibacillus TaxID=2622809 RepID=UPI000E671AD4|nr:MULTISPECIES: hydroxymethylglutaryl-CoA lyase [unclassified Rummeliibacillus]RIJ63854.1 hydroxymethylglutaryl-CoA lyase [Rummeliibacillus sp. POC4]RPJ96747.1 hydroxymethylglutaryl-CoA lyase [Rummeliibacillus sp. TYF005]
MLNLPNQVTIIEVGPRDGLQNTQHIIPTIQKLNFIHSLQDAGIKEMEITSFVSPKWVPQMADHTDIVMNVNKIGKQYVLAPNEIGIQKALSLNSKAIAVFVGVSNTFNKKNINQTTLESMNTLTPIIKDLKKEGVFVRACISTAFYCPYEGGIFPEDTLALCRQFVDLGVDELSVADTIGMANPVESYSLFSLLKQELPNVLLTAHFHDTRQMALANIFASLQAGINRFDSSAGGLGGCPFAKGATGNVATEDVVFMLEQMGIQTGIDIQKVCKSLKHLQPFLKEEISSAQYKLYQQR